MRWIMKPKQKTKIEWKKEIKELYEAKKVDEKVEIVKPIPKVQEKCVEHKSECKCSEEKKMGFWKRVENWFVGTSTDKNNDEVSRKTVK